MPVHSIIITLIACISTFFLNKKKTLLLLFIFSTYMPSGQSLNIYSISFTPLRIIILFLVLRMLFKGEYKGLIFNRLDKTIFLWGFTVVFFSLIRSFDSGTVIYQAGFMYNTLGLYVVLRSLIKDVPTIEYVISWLPIIILPLAIAMLYETFSGGNIFTFFGGGELFWIRAGRFRAMGPFRIPILAGVFGAVQIPFLWSLWMKGIEKKVFLFIGFISAALIVFSSNSGAPLLTLISVILGIALWRFRDRMKYIQWSLVISLLGLSLLMKAPVWFIMAKLSGVVGGGGWHRAYLVDRAIHYFNEWWLIGSNNTGHWMPYNLPQYPNSADITNMFIRQGLNGGIIGLILFVYIFVLCYKYIGLGLKSQSFDFHEKHLLWAMGVALLGHLIAFMSVTYFDQIVVIYYFLLAAISTIKVDQIQNQIGAKSATPGKADSHESPNLYDLQSLHSNCTPKNAAHQNSWSWS